MSATFDYKNPLETRVITIDVSPDLAVGETLTSIISTSISVVRGGDAIITLIVSNPAINPTSFSIINTNGVNVTIAASTAVQAVVSGGLDGVWYQLTFLCTTSNPNKTIAVTGILPVSLSA